MSYMCIRLMGVDCGSYADFAVWGWHLVEWKYWCLSVGLTKWSAPYPSLEPWYPESGYPWLSIRSWIWWSCGRNLCGSWTLWGLHHHWSWWKRCHRYYHHQTQGRHGADANIRCWSWLIDGAIRVPHCGVMYLQEILIHERKFLFLLGGTIAIYNGSPWVV